MADLYTKLNEVQKKIQGKNVTMIEACTVLLGFQEKLGLYKYHRGHGKFEYFANLLLHDRQAQSTVSENDMLIYVNHLENVEAKKSPF